ncbi:hypothetical protein BJV78DRAFT_1288215 [Lactifluus subvellereus]|nr:hypothetical protein BJV78DRAFT_1288215 [Lactifluus subvellereus]
MSQRVSTRSQNAAQHPGLVVKGKPRRSTKEVAAERQAKEDAKQEKARTKAAGIKRVAEPMPLRRTWSYANVLTGSDVEMSDGDQPGSEFNPEVKDIPGSESNTGTDIETAAKLEENSLVRPAVDDDTLDLDPTVMPNPMKTRLAAPATGSGDRQVVSGQEKLLSWRMPTFSDNESPDAELMEEDHGGDSGEEKGKAIAVVSKRDGKANASHQKRPDTQRVMPKSTQKGNSIPSGKKGGL